MEKKKGAAGFISAVYLLGALVLLLWVCGNCCPRVRQMVVGLDGSPIRDAFGVLSEGLESGEPVRETMGRTVQVFFEEN
jgi:hypothetical protein